MTENNTNITNATFQYPDSALLYKRKSKCLFCGNSVWAHVQTATDDYFLDCGCGETNVRKNFEKWKHLFVYGETGVL